MNILDMPARPAGIRVIGLTGGIATGKNSVARFFQEKGALVIDADLLAREAVEPGSRGLAEVVATFGSDILTPDGQLDRKRLGGLSSRTAPDAAGWKAFSTRRSSDVPKSASPKLPLPVIG